MSSQRVAPLGADKYAQPAAVEPEGIIVRGRGSRSLRRTVLYRLDSWIMKRSSQMTMVCIMFAVEIAVLGVIISLISTESPYVSDGMWAAWTFMADPGTHADVGKAAVSASRKPSSCGGGGGGGGANESNGGNGGTAAANITSVVGGTAESMLWPQRLVAFITTWLGILMFAVVLGIVVESIREKMANLKEGKSTVAERDHTLLLGWTDKTCGVIKEIALANESEGGGVVVVLATEDKERIEADIREQLRPTDLNVNGSRTKVVVRKGSPLYANDLNKVSAHDARAIVLLAETGMEADKADAQVRELRCL